jgi:hypothetical protein
VRPHTELRSKSKLLFLFLQSGFVLFGVVIFLHQSIVSDKYNYGILGLALILEFINNLLASFIHLWDKCKEDVHSLLIVVVCARIVARTIPHSTNSLFQEAWKGFKVLGKVEGFLKCLAWCNCLCSSLGDQAAPGCLSLPTAVLEDKKAAVGGEGFVLGSFSQEL